MFFINLKRFLVNPVKFRDPLTCIPFFKIKESLRQGYNHRNNEIYIYRALFTYVLGGHFVPSELQ